MEEGREDKLAKAGSAAGKTHGKAESTAEEVVDDVHCRQVHQTKAEAGEEADGEVEDDDVGVCGELDVEGGKEEADGGEENSDK